MLHFSIKAHNVWLGIVPAILGGFFLSMAELARPFMILLLPILLLICGYQYFQAKRPWLLAAFLLPVLVFSGGWHVKLLLHNERRGHAPTTIARVAQLHTNAYVELYEALDLVDVPGMEVDVVDGRGHNQYTVKLISSMGR